MAHDGRGDSAQSAPAEPILISALEHFAYCPRQAALIHVDGVWADNEHTARGTVGHRRADDPGARTARGRIVRTGMAVWSEQLGLAGRADAVEFWPSGEVVPVEYKIGRRQGDAADIQLCAEAFCLEEMLQQPVEAGYLWLAASRRRIRVEFKDELRRKTLGVIESVRALLADRQLPPAVADERCRQCQLHAHCLPDLVAKPLSIADYLRSEVLTCGS